MTINYQLTDREVVNGLLKYRKIYARLWVVIAAAAFGVMLLTYGSVIAHPMSSIVQFEGGLLVAICLSVLFLRPILVRRAYKKFVKSNPTCTASKEISFNMDGLVVVSSDFRSEVKWKYFKRITQDDLYIYLHTDDLGSVTILPKRAFDEATMQEFLRCTHHPSAK